MNVNTPTAAPMAFFVPSSNAVYDRATQLEGQWVTQRAKTLESLRRLYPDAELIPATLVQEKQNDGYRRPWVEITEARYIDQLETLPPWTGAEVLAGSRSNRWSLRAGM
jgi:hypothetical protein